MPADFTQVSRHAGLQQSLRHCPAFLWLVTSEQSAAVPTESTGPCRDRMGAPPSQGSVLKVAVFLLSWDRQVVFVNVKVL